MTVRPRERNPRTTGSQRKKSSIISDAAWRSARPTIKELYLEKNKGADFVTERLQKDFQLNVTTRQLKTKLKHWGYDDKRIEGSAYRAMFYIMEEMREDMNFEAVLRGGYACKEKPACEIRKEVKRQHIDPATPGWQSVKDALEFLRRESKIRPAERFMPSILSYLAARQIPTHDIVYDFNLTDNDSDDSCSTTSEDSPLDPIEPTSPVINYPDGSYQQRRPVFGHADSSLDMSQRPRIWSQIPHPNAFTTNLHLNVLPQTAENQIHHTFHDPSLPHSRGIGEPEILSMEEPFGDLTLSLADMTLQFDHVDPRKKPWEKFLGIELEQHYRHPSREGNRLIVEFVAYYIQQTLAGFDTLDDYDHADRREARAKLQQMLQNGNQQILPSINWISAVIGSHDKGAQLSAFYEDCYACINGNTSYVARVVKPAIAFALSTLGEKQRTTANLAESPTSRARRYKALADSFDGEREFNQSISLLEQHGHQDSPIHLTLRYHYAWYLLQKGHADQALAILMKCANTAERLMGCKHLVTVNCYAVAARAYLQLGNTKLARNDLEMAILRLDQCPNPLRAYYYRLRERLAIMNMNDGDNNSALPIIEQVFSFRLQTLGPASAPTWEALEHMCQILEQLGRKQEADHRRRDLQTQYESEWRRRSAD